LDQKADILMKYFRENKSQRAIARELGISRTTVQKYIKDFKTKHEKLMELKQDKDGNKIKILALIEEMASKPKYDTSSRTRVKLTEEIIDEIDKLIAKNEKNKLLGRHKQLMKKIDIHEYLVEKGYDIGYTTVCNYIRENYEKKEAYIRQQYDLGETLEFDWGDVKLTIAGKATTLNMGLFTTAKGSYHYARLYENQKMENFLHIHVEAFNKIGGIHREIVYDNMKQAVKKFVGKNEKEATEDLIKLSLYYGFKYRFCNIKSGNEKGHVERGIEFVRRKVFSIKTEFDSIDEANEYLAERIFKLNSKKRSWLKNQSPIEILNQEKKYLLPLKPSYDTSRRVEARVNKYSVINIDQNKYSVPDYLVGKFVTAKIYPNDIKIYYKGNKIAEHKRSFKAHHWTIDINHFTDTLKNKPGALHSSVGRHQLCPELKDIYNKYYTNNPKDFILLLELIKEKDLESILDAIKELEEIKTDIVNTDNIKNIVFKLPREIAFIEPEKDTSILKASIQQISALNQMFNLQSIGGFEN
jgi:DNA-binding Lrp family transcriptional regulator